MRILLVAMLLFFGASVYSQEEYDLPELHNGAVSMLTVYNSDFSVAFMKGDRRGLIFLSPCEDRADVVIDQGLRGQHRIVMDIEVLSVDLERSVYLRRIAFRVSDKSNAETVQRFIDLFHRSRSCGAI